METPDERCSIATMGRGSQGTATTKTLGQMRCQRRILRPGETSYSSCVDLEGSIEIDHQ